MKSGMVFKERRSKKLIDRMPRLCLAVIEADGGYFDEKYAP
jgi:hypothetical protein